MAIPNRRSTALCLATLAALTMSPMCNRTASATRFTPYPGRRPRGVVAADNVFTPAAGRSKGVVMLVHGGSWLYTGPNTLMVADEQFWHARGYTVYDVDYRPAVPSLADVEAAYRWLRARVHDRPICVKGDSAGGTMALLLAEQYPTVACVVTEGAISNILRMPLGFRHDVRGLLPGHMRSFSPVHYARRLRQPVLMAGSTLDQVVPEPEQLSEMKVARPQTRTMLLAGAPAVADNYNFTHAAVTAQALHKFRRAETKLVARSLRSPANGP